MTAAQDAFLWILGHVRDLAFVFSGERTSISGLPLLLCASASSKKARISLSIVSSARDNLCSDISNFARHRTAFGFPFVASAIEDFHILMTKQPKCPERVARPPVRLVAVKNTGGIRRDAVPLQSRANFSGEI